ncbi:molybdopterin-guanine dinucleotide biosynthesis protein MobA, partial [Escherichia coli]|nr:molybdopterin-guanine dinucleotide biosynthesis protein MobA [Escherichia coli]
MKRIHSAKWRSKAAQEQRAAEQAVRDAAKQEAVEVYKTFSELDLEIVVDVRSFTVAALAEPEEIVLPETRSGSSSHEAQSPVLVAPIPHTHVRGVKSYRDKEKVSKVVINNISEPNVADADINTLWKTSPSKTKNMASKSTAESVKRKQANPRQDNIFKRFTTLLIGFFKEKFIWAKKKPDPTEIEHDRHVAENYVFDEVLGVYVSRADHEQRARFNGDDKEFSGYKPTPDEIKRFPSRLANTAQTDRELDYMPSLVADKKSLAPKLKPNAPYKNRL